MPQLLNSWNSFSIRQRVIFVLATVAMFATVLGIARIAAAPNMVLLYSGLESGPAGEVVRALEQKGAQYQVRGGAIYVESGIRDELRMTLASEGMPSSNTQGYEILDSLSGFGTTSQMFDAAYWRAKEGELSRTIVGASNVDSARVHIAHSGSNPFQKHIAPTASVSVNTRGTEISSEQARAFKFLVASAVAGLAPEDVAVIDSSGKLIGGPENSSASDAVEGRAVVIADKVRHLLEARVGFGNAVVEVSIDTNNATESIRERVFDPAGRVAISTDSEERTTNARNAGAGQVTVASNLPNNTSAANSGSSNQNSETRERVNYEVSETTRDVVREAGAIRRITAAVLINGIPETLEDGTVKFATRSTEELAVLQELVQSAIGFDPNRGDVVTLKSMNFEPTVATGTKASDAIFSISNLDIMTLIQLAVLSVVAILLGLFVVRPLIKKSEAPLLQRPNAIPEMSGRLPANNEEQALTGEIQSDGDGDFSPQLENEAADFMPPDTVGNVPDPVDRLRALIADRQEETVEILRSWLDDKEEKV